MEAAKAGITIHRRMFRDIKEAFVLYSQANVVFNCTGLGALILGGVEDKTVYSARVRQACTTPVTVIHQ